MLRLVPAVARRFRAKPVRRRCLGQPFSLDGLARPTRRVTLFAFPEQLFNGLFNLVQHPLIPCPKPATCPPDQIFSMLLVVVFFYVRNLWALPTPTQVYSMTDTDESNQTSWFSSRTHQAPRCATSPPLATTSPVHSNPQNRLTHRRSTHKQAI